MPDLVNAVDAVIGKLGYGTVSEILAHDVPMIYVQRTHWNEQQYLLDLMHRHGAPIEMSMDDFNNGNWRPYLEAVCRGGNNRPRYDDGATDPAAVIVGALERVLHEVEAGRGEDKGEGGEEGGPSRDPLPHIGAHVATAAS
jgi:L-arabinokinase